MKLRNKKTGEIGEMCIVWLPEKAHGCTCENKNYGTLAELNEEWEDNEEPKDYWFLSGRGEVRCIEDENTAFDKDHKSIGNYFETREEAEKAVEKLKAWKRLRDKGFRFTAWRNGISLDESTAGQVRYEFPIDNKDDIEKDLDLLFGGEE